jgi:AraC-like DNA-binding protein
MAHRTVALDPDSLASVASGTSLRVNRLSPGERPSHLRQIQSPQGWGLDVTTLHCRLQADGGLVPGFAAVLLVLRGNDSTIGGIRLETGAVLTLPAGSAIEAVIAPGLSLAGAVISGERWSAIQEAATGMVVEPPAGPPRAVRLDAARTAAVAAAVLRTSAALADASDGVSIPADPFDVLNGYLAGVADAVAAAGLAHAAIDRSAHRRFRQALLARDFIFAHIAEPMPISRISAAIGVSRRQLEYAFQTTFGVSPAAFVHLQRLNEIRRALMAARRADRSVTAIALDYGVRHLGRFAVSYRALFGESPSATLGRHGPARATTRRSDGRGG